MKTVEISYDPYRMKTRMSIDGFDVHDTGNYDKIRKFIDAGVPLQTWIEPVEYQGWKGLVNEISHPEDNDSVKLEFYGRDIDYNDLVRSIEAQNSRRAEENRVEYSFEQKTHLDDKSISENIEQVVQELKGQRFRELVLQRGEETELRKRYDKLEENYSQAKEDVFYIVFAGTYSSGKSTLLNALMRHNVLPTHQGTCTSKNCKIRHDSSLGSGVSLACFDAKKNLIGEKRVFSSDDDCRAAFKEKTNQSGVAEMELGVDLSHLYPNSVNKDKFNIVLVDTPGMDSAKSIKDGVNLHDQIALDAITMRNKPMIVLCADANYTDNQRIGEFMREILEHSPEDYRSFTDRFLFLLNKGDTIEYANDHTSENVKRSFAEYLTNSDKWGIKGDEKELRELADLASRFVPRVFMTAAGVEIAIQQGAPNFSDEDCENEEKQILADRYEDFEKQVWRRKKEHYYLSRYCDIPSFRADELDKEFQKALENGDEVRAVHLQCGIVPVEMAIRDYIERYAYPIKVRDLLDTFEDILHDVESFSKGVLEEMKNKEDELGENNRQWEEANISKDDKEKKRDVLENVKKIIDEKNEELNAIQFNADALGETLTELRADIEANEDVSFIRGNGGKVNTGQKSPAEVENEIKRRIANIQGAFDDALWKANKRIDEIMNEHTKQLKSIYGSIEEAIEAVKDNGLFSEGGYSFADSVTWKMHFENINFEDYKAEILNSVKDAKTRTERVRNSKKDEYRYSGNLFKMFRSIFMRDTILVTKREDGSYDMSELLNQIDAWYQCFTQQTNEMKETCNDALDKGKEKANELIGTLLNQIEYFQNDIAKQRENIDFLSGNIGELNKKISELEDTRKWLKELQGKIRRDRYERE